MLFLDTFVLCLLTTLISAKYHELSYKTLEPPPEFDKSDFGFSIGYQSVKDPFIVIGAPHADNVGRVYKCAIEDVIKKDNVSCAVIDIDVEKLAKSIRKTKYDPNFCLGASIASAGTYFLTCAPLWTSRDPYGKCFTYDGEARVVKGYLNFMDSPVYRGFRGWTTLVDEEKNEVFVVTPNLYTFRAGPKFVISSVSKGKNNNKYNSLEMTHYNYKDRQTSSYGYTVIKVGKFFTDTNAIYHAVSTTHDDAIGKVFFHDISKRNGGVLKNVVITDDVTGSMFGATMHAVDIDGDSRLELIVSAPAHATKTAYDSGAMHLFIGGDSHSMNKTNQRTIVSNKEGGRFGTAVTSSDIDGDGIPEIFVSAPYENDFSGALYVISGLEIRQFLKKELKMVMLNEFNNLQRLHSVGRQGFGFSLYFIPDIDDNGCNELVVGSPLSAKALLYRNVPKINVTISSEVQGFETVPEEIFSFTIKVCINVSYPEKPAQVSTNLIVQNKISGQAIIYDRFNKSTYTKPSNTELYILKMWHKNNTFCREVNVNVTNKDPGHYNFQTVVAVDKNISTIKEFDSKWVELSDRSKTEKSHDVERGCNGIKECAPKLTMDLKWTISNVSYQLGETDAENMTVTVNNTGSSAYSACVKLRLSGARVQRFDNAYCADDDSGYKCFLPKPFRTGMTHSVNFNLDTTSATNEDKEIKAIVSLSKICDSETNVERSLVVPVLIDTTNIHVQGFAKYVFIKDKDYNNKTLETITTDHFYTVISNDSFIWRHMQAAIVINKTNYIIGAEGRIDERKCHSTVDEHNVLLLCDFNLEPNKPIKLDATMFLSKEIAKNNIINDSVAVVSYLRLNLIPTDVSLTKLLKSEVRFQKISLYQNKNVMILIFVILGCLLLACIIYALYKFGFFKRKEMKKLHELKQEIRRQSVRRNTSVGIDSQLEPVDDASVIDDVFEGEASDAFKTNDDDTNWIFDVQSETAINQNKEIEI